jgi:predicted aldo/keto reductase-like oxidoreductase
VQYRKLGRTGLDVGVVGLGSEFLWHEPLEVVQSVVDLAVENGVNYIDLWMPSPEVRDNFGDVLQGRREKVLLAGHLGSTLKDNQYFKTRDRAMGEKYLQDFYTRLKTDYIDILMLHFIDEQDEYDCVFGNGWILEYALKLKREGRVRYIGMSSHKVPVSLQAVNNGYVDVLMFPVNPAFDALPGDTQLEALWQKESYNQLDEKGYKPAINRKELYSACVKQNVGIVAMKPYAGGWLLNGFTERSLKMTPAQCLNYSLSQPGVSTVVPGCKNIKEMQDALTYLSASDEEKDYSSAISESQVGLAGSCMYCNHCLPCPSRINIAEMTRLADSAAYGVSDEMKGKYDAIAHKASACIQCGACMKRCPFGVDVISNMERAVALFEG